jgi:hypothetical protein
VARASREELAALLAEVGIETAAPGAAAGER